MSAKHTHTLSSIRHIREHQTLPHSGIVSSLDIRTLNVTDSNKHSHISLVLITAKTEGTISVYVTSSLSVTQLHTQQQQHTLTQRLQFTRQKGFQAHSDSIDGLHFHHHKPLFASASADRSVKVWNFQDITTPRLIKCLPHPSVVWDARYSKSGLLLIGCFDEMLRVYGKEPLFPLVWSVQLDDIVSIAWSPCNRICASFKSGNCLYMQVWSSSFQTIFKLPQDGVWNTDNGLVFASNHLLLSSRGWGTNTVYWYRMSKPKVMKVFLDTCVLPFCRDVLNIVIEYLPFVTRVTHDTIRDMVGPVASLSPEAVVAQGYDDKIYLYKVDGKKPLLLVRLPHKYCRSLVTCVYPCSGKEIGFMLVSATRKYEVCISVITSQVCIM